VSLRRFAAFVGSLPDTRGNSSRLAPSFPSALPAPSEQTNHAKSRGKERERGWNGHNRGTRAGIIFADDLASVVDAIRNGVSCGWTVKRSVDAIAEKKAARAGAVLVTSNDLAQVVNAVSVRVGRPGNVELSVSTINEKESVIDIVGVAPNDLAQVVDAVCVGQTCSRRTERGVRAAVIQKTTNYGTRTLNLPPVTRLTAPPQ
jgi:hypothetical protein